MGGRGKSNPVRCGPCEFPAGREGAQRMALNNRFQRTKNGMSHQCWDAVEKEVKLDSLECVLSRNGEKRAGRGSNIRKRATNDF